MSEITLWVKPVPRAPATPVDVPVTTTMQKAAEWAGQALLGVDSPSCGLRFVLTVDRRHPLPDDDMAIYHTHEMLWLGTMPVARQGSAA